MEGRLQLTEPFVEAPAVKTCFVTIRRCDQLSAKLLISSPCLLRRVSGARQFSSRARSGRQAVRNVIGGWDMTNARLHQFVGAALGLICLARARGARGQDSRVRAASGACHPST